MSEELISSNQRIGRSTKRQLPVALIGIGVLLFVIELYTFGAHRHDRFYALLAIDFRDSFCFCGLVDVRAQAISKKHSLDYSAWGCAVSIDPCADPPRLATDIYRCIWDGR